MDLMHLFLHFLRRGRAMGTQAYVGKSTMIYYVSIKDLEGDTWRFNSHYASRWEAFARFARLEKFQNLQRPTGAAIMLALPNEPVPNAELICKIIEGDPMMLDMLQDIAEKGG